MPQPDPLEQLLRYGNPNPQRIGCPGQVVLQALARQELPTDHPAENHLGECSPCFREFQEYQAKWQRNRRRTRIGLTVAALPFLTIGLFWSYQHLQLKSHPSLVAGQNQNASPINPLQIPGVLNYQGISAKRGTESQPTAPTSEQIISRSVRELAIVLPIGREAGHYVVEIFPKAEKSKPLASYTGIAFIDADGVTTLRTHVDFTAFPAGTYTVTWHMVDSDFGQSGTFVLR